MGSSSSGGICKDRSKPLTSPTVEAEESGTDMWGTLVGSMQDDVVVRSGKISGTLKKLTSGQLVTDWGEGYFLALKFANNDATVTSIKVGLDPSASQMEPVELDEDMNGVFKITDKDTQKFKVISTNGTVTKTDIYDLSELELEE